MFLIRNAFSLFYKSLFVVVFMFSIASFFLLKNDDPNQQQESGVLVVVVPEGEQLQHQQQQQQQQQQQPPRRHDDDDDDDEKLLLSSHDHRRLSTAEKANEETPLKKNKKSSSSLSSKQKLDDQEQQHGQTNKKKQPQEEERPAAGAQGRPLILVMGLPRSGSISIHNFFTCNGIKSAHYCCGGRTTKTHFSCGGNDAPTCGSCVHDNMYNDRPPFQGCSGTEDTADNEYAVYSQYDVETGEPYSWFLPQHYTLPLIHEHYPDSIWILNTRSSADIWATNVLHWYSVTNRIFNAFNISYYSSNGGGVEWDIAPQHKLTGKDLFRELDKSLERAKNKTEHIRRHVELVKIYNHHIQKLKDYAERYPTHKLIEINVDDIQTTSRTLSKEFNLNANCYQFNSQELDNDWKDFTLKL